MIFWGLLLCNATSDRLETGWVTPWGSGLSIWIETGLWKQGVSFLDLSKISGRTGIIWFLKGFYYVMQHQIVLKLIEWHPGVVDCQSELKLVCGNRVSFLDLSKITGRTGIIDILRAFIMQCNIRSSWNWLRDTLGVVDCQSELKLVCGNRAFPF